MIWRTRDRSLDLADRAQIMGILNVTPDSFSDGGRHHRPRAALARARAMIAEGAGIIDIGGESTRPGAAPVAADDEAARVLPVIEALRAEWDGPISIDTMKAEVARAALEAGADIVNDVTGLRDPAMVALAAETACGVVVMHMRGEPRTMQTDPRYDDVVAEVRAFFDSRLAALTAAGIDSEAIVFDPGIGFGKTLEHNLALLRGLGALQFGDRPLLIGLSRKSFIGRLLDSPDPAARDWPTVALTAWTRESGARIHRVHDVRPNADALRMVEAIRTGGA
jgi:dihydropteroate synthase